MKHFSGKATVSRAKAGPTLTPVRVSEQGPPHHHPGPVSRRSVHDTPSTLHSGSAFSPSYVAPIASRPGAAVANAADMSAAPVTVIREQSPEQPYNRQLERLASHRVQVPSDLSSSDSETEPDTAPFQPDQGVGPAEAAGTHPVDSFQAANCQQRQSLNDAATPSAALLAQQQQQHLRQRKPQQQRTPADGAFAQQRKPAAAAGGGAAGVPPSSSSRRPGPTARRQHTWAALSAFACLVLLVAYGSSVRSLAAWASSGMRSSSIPATRPGRVASPAGVAAGGAGAAAAAAAAAAEAAPGGVNAAGWLTAGQSWASGYAATAAAAARGGASASQWLGQQVPAPLQAAAARAWGLAAHAGSTVQHTAAAYASRITRSSNMRVRNLHGWVSSSFYSNSGSSRSVATHAASSQSGSTGAAAPPSSSSTGGSSSGSSGSSGSIKLYAVVDAAAPSPFKAHSPKGSTGLDWSANWGQVLQHMAQRLEWTDPRFNLQVITQDELKQDAAARARLSAALSSPNPPQVPGSNPTSPIFVGIGVSDPEVASFLAQATAQLPTALFWNSAASLSSSSRVDGYAPGTAGPFAQLLASAVGFSKEAKAAEVFKTLDVLWGRDTSDDLLYIWLVLLNQYVTPVPMVANTTKGTDLASLYCMIKNCGQKIVDCVTDKTCKAGLDCLQACAFNDQVCQYRCIVSYETPQFEQFALCILQLHNCRGLNAEVPMVPDPAPMTHWRGAPLTHEAAEDLFIGWLSQGPQIPSGGEQLMKPYSWLVAAGKNPAYDAFGCQHQLYYRGKGKGQLWYEPVFRVTTLEGQQVWRRRRYRVRRGEKPGTFYYSVLDNGVTSNEYWRIVDCAEDLTYCLFYYSGAASAAGLSYTGAVLGTRDGLWPGAYTERIHRALQQTGIEPWELSMPDNSKCADAPLTQAV